ncbi:hypothetical protein A3A76_03690 [Candidatus Woesebacteria bacterium RIFCSPLOWO2_01_FULL_39_23]|uniref:Uncharacterized protein n=1 Tax=Candidatus Woesebacteria bacterium RIFCSPHIGHO2_01_FULL_40_22 TaxID=1802499 RepID=A0A1F7YJP1_9BACT|nr:MAG: hypothetical protein A2141_00335 [Candidatus Woesebacteria bacterium RBG_16_40_11]OGM27556.1 MAG: hypothetical protein A2628_02090 [Candidatus Woesebacteria bacterium RIFCSPHIGHO2_01_FULL_40_22]OGM62730.1 MAG: hypothetical protein A3A76_03690 [Candidatus Woesebacteria bacterium RIFCSPLOWO2_01_FULL_39_23]
MLNLIPVYFNKYYKRVYVLTLLISYIFYLGETFIHPGIFRLNENIPIFLISVLSLIPHFINTAHTNYFKSNNNNVANIIAAVTTPIFFSFYLIFGYIESSNYSNYVFSTYHVYYQNMIFIVLTSIFYLISISRVKLPVIKKLPHINYEKLRIKFTFPKAISIRVLKILNKGINSINLFFIYLHKLSFRSLLIFICILFLSFENISNLISPLTSEFVNTWKYVGKSYDEKMGFKWGAFYSYMLFIKNNTTEDSVIYHPAVVGPFLWEGSQVVLRYFLYPRILVNDEDIKSDYPSETITHALLIGPNELAPEGSIPRRGFPDLTLNVSAIKIFNAGSIKTNIYTPDSNLYSGKKGLIILRK